MSFLQCFFTLLAQLFVIDDWAVSIWIFICNLFHKNLLLNLSRFFALTTVFHLLVIGFFLGVSQVLEVLSFLDKDFSTVFYGSHFFQWCVQLWSHQLLKIWELINVGSKLTWLVLISFELQLIFSIAEGSYKLDDICFGIKSNLSSLLSDKLIIKRCHFDSIFNTNSYKSLFKMSLSEKKFSVVLSEMVTDFVFILLANFIKELRIKHTQHLELICLFRNNFMNTLRLNINWLAHIF